MICLNCGNEKFEVKNARLKPEIKGEIVEIIAPAFVCTNCQAPLMDDTQMSIARRITADEYRKKHHLLTSEEIIKFRTILGMSQTAFAHYLKVGEASIKRWETYFVQEDAQDEHMRLKCDAAYAELNALEVHWKNRMPDIYNGNRRFSLELFKQTVRYLVEFTKSSLFLNKALFYADFEHYKRHQMSITGTCYVHLEYGPCPDQYHNLIKSLLNEGELKSSGNHMLKTTEKADLSLFADSEKDVLSYIAALTKEDGGKRMSKLSHEEAAYKKTQPFECISYELAKELKI
jgi:putative zinc finger/helix-turn-helix YgiT family protein